MTIRDWCSNTMNVYYGSTVFTINQTGKRPIRAVAGCIPDELLRRDVRWITVTRINPDNMGFKEVAVKLL